MCIVFKYICKWYACKRCLLLRLHQLRCIDWRLFVRPVFLGRNIYQVAPAVYLTTHVCFCCGFFFLRFCYFSSSTLSGRICASLSRHLSLLLCCCGEIVWNL
ncbi:unnamed protein product [Ceratitis capitata]|uniref:(Mediterranean fruit fly) hypothetical protein n=1 Tax=Ceratitis capitata TaxID=7213 RepID=A0A811V8T8_CERCA|nr:unnamed protein product [Ceratitis capitata]